MRGTYIVLPRRGIVPQDLIVTPLRRRAEVLQLHAIVILEPALKGRAPIGSKLCVTIERGTSFPQLWQMQIAKPPPWLFAD